MPHPEKAQPAAPSRFRWRRLVQYRLRTLLIVMTILAAGLGWWSHKARQQRVAVEVIRSAGGLIIYDFEKRNLQRPSYWPAGLVDALGVDFFADVHVVDLQYDHSGPRYMGLNRWQSNTGTDAQMAHIGRLSKLRILRLGGATTDAGSSNIRGLTALEQLDLGSTRVTDAGLEHLEGLMALRRLSLDAVHLTDSGLKHLSRFSRLEQLNISRTRVTNAGLEHLAGMTALKSLSLRELPVTDSGLEKIKGLKSLEGLDLAQTRITDAGLEHLRAFTALIRLDLYGTQVTDAGLRHLRGLTSLQSLQLSDTQVTDAGLEHLRDLTALRKIDAVNTKITNAGVSRLKQALPNCEIETQPVYLE